MTSFTDSTGKTWNIAIHAGAIKRIALASEGEWNLRDFDSVFDRIDGGEPAQLAAFWCLLCLAVEPGDPLEFAKAMASDDGSVLLRARAAFWRAWAEWYGSGGRVFAARLARAAELQDKLTKAAEAI